MWLYVPSVSAVDTEDLNSGSSSQECPPLPPVTWRGKLMQQRTWSRLWKKASWARLLSGVTLRPLTRIRGVERWISSLLDSPASRFLQLGKESTQKTSDGSGATLTGFFASYDQESCSWRTSQGSLFQGWAQFSGPWPAWGSMRNGECFERPMPGHLTDARASSFSGSTPTQDDPFSGDSWPTPDALARKRVNGGEILSGPKKGEYIKDRPTLAALATAWPTPTAGDSRSSGGRDATAKKTGKTHSGTSLTDAARQWPTPAARDYKGANSKEHIEKARGRAHMDQLPNFVAHGRPAPMTESGGSSGDKPRVLNPAFVEALMGLRTQWTDCASLETESSRSKPLTLSSSSGSE